MNWLAAAVEGMTDESARSQNIWTLGELRSALRQVQPDLPVVVNGRAPAELHAYRGYYERLSIGCDRRRDDYETKVNLYASYGDYQPGASEVTIAEPVTAAEMVKALDLADGEIFEGYKGGQYEMDAGTFMHVAEWGDTGLAVYGIRVEAERVVIECGEYSW